MKRAAARELGDARRLFVLQSRLVFGRGGDRGDINRDSALLSKQGKQHVVLTLKG